MYVIIGFIFLIILTARLAAKLLGYKLKPWLPQSGMRRYYIDMAITAAVLLSLAVISGLHASLPLAFGVALVATAVATSLQTARQRKIEPKSN